MRPFNLTTDTFNNDITPSWTVSLWDTTCTVPQTGISVSLFDVLDSSLNLLSSAYADVASARALVNNSNANTQKVRALLGYENGEAKSGLEPVIAKYWGAGAPPGLSRERQVFLKYSGYVVPAGTNSVTMVFGGQGRIRVFRNGSEIGKGIIREPLVEPTLATKADIEREGGYLIIETSVTQNDYIEIFYCNNRESWGGLFAKVIPGTGHATDWTTFRTALRDAGYMGASFMSAATAATRNVPYCMDALLQIGAGQTPTLELQVTLTSSTEDKGYYLANVGGQNQLIDNADSSLLLRINRRISLSGGFKHYDGTLETYPRFFGRITSITPNGGGDSATVVCHGFESMIEGNFDENYPDRISYIANGFIDYEWLGYPVYPIQALDAWPLETAVAELCGRAGIDATSLGRSPTEADPTYAKYAYRNSVTQAIAYGQKRLYARSLSDTTDLVTLQRQVNYGNLGPIKKSYLNDDDEYLFASKVSERLLDTVTQITSHFGYDFFFDAAGQATLGSRNNPQSWEYFADIGDGDLLTTPSAVGGRYASNSSTGAWTKTITAFCSRIDIFTGIGAIVESDGLRTTNGGRFQVTVDRHELSNAWTALTGETKVFSTYSTHDESFYYDDINRTDGTNACVFTAFELPFAEYRITITGVGNDPADSGSGSVIRLNGAAIFERDQSETPYPQALSTLGNVFEESPSSNEKDLRNQVIVIGQRRATVTDSAKFVEKNPNNPFTEFYVSVSADPGSIYDPDAPNFVGGKRATVIMDDRAVDSDFARWLSRTILYRYNMPKLDARITHSVIPVIEVRDPIRVTDERDDLLPFLLWVKAFREHWTAEGDSTVDIEFNGYPELPSYQPREDLDIEALFQSSPAANVHIAYKNLYAENVLDPGMPNMPLVSRELAAIPNTTSVTIPDGGYADDAFLLRPSTVVEKPELSVLLNHPYRHFWNVDDDGQTLLFDFQEGDGTQGIYTPAFYQFPDRWVLSFEKFGINADPPSDDLTPMWSESFATGTTLGDRYDFTGEYYHDNVNDASYTQVVIDPTGGRHGGPAMVQTAMSCLDNLPFLEFPDLNYPSTGRFTNDFIATFAVNCKNTTWQDFGHLLSVTVGSPTEFAIGLDADRRFMIVSQYYRDYPTGFGGTVNATSTVTAPANGWFHVEIRIHMPSVLTASDGWIKVRMNQQLVLEATGLQVTQGYYDPDYFPFVHGFVAINGINLGSAETDENAIPGWYLCDYAQFYTVGVDPNAYVGDVSVGVRWPVSSFNGSGAADNINDPVDVPVYNLVTKYNLLSPDQSVSYTLTSIADLAVDVLAYAPFVYADFDNRFTNPSPAGILQFAISSRGATKTFRMSKYWAAPGYSSYYDTAVRSGEYNEYGRTMHKAGHVLGQAFGFDAENTITMTVNALDPNDFGWSGYSFDVPFRIAQAGIEYIYRTVLPTEGRTGNPFYDPYSSEAGIGNLVKFTFDALISGFYRIALWAVNPNGQFDFPVAYLTRPDAAPLDENAHWLYTEAGSRKEFVWDGTDSLGLWNRYQSRDYARKMEGAFADKPLAVGAGFYVWNDQSIDPKTQIGDDVPENYDEFHRPLFTKGRYSRFYLKIEAKSDRLLRKSGGISKIYTVNTHDDLKVIPTARYAFTHLGEPTQCRMLIEDWDAAAGEWTESTSANGWSFMTEGGIATSTTDPEQPLTLSAQYSTGSVIVTATVRFADSVKIVGSLSGFPSDADVRSSPEILGPRPFTKTFPLPSVGQTLYVKAFGYYSTLGGLETGPATLSIWNTGTDTADIRNGKPVRVSFTPVPRRGKLFWNEEGVPDENKVSVQLFRTVHMKDNTFDQFWTFYHKPWEGDIHDKNLAQNNAENRDSKRITSRMTSDDSHTIEFSTGDWINGEDLAYFEWIFQPEFFKKDFGGDGEESIRYCDYEQLYSLPGFDTKQGGGTARTDTAFMTLAFMNYLFYLSAHVLDRSGRRQHCLDVDFKDQSKIVSPDWRSKDVPEYLVSYERFDADVFLVRSIFARQWVEPGWKTPVGGNYISGSPVDPDHPGTGGITDPLELLWVQPLVTDFDPFTTPMAGNVEDKWVTAYMTDGTFANQDFWRMWTNRASGAHKTIAVHDNTYALDTFNLWNFDRSTAVGIFRPSPCRDFLPYWREPAMPDWGTADTRNTIDGQFTQISSLGEFNIKRGVNILEIPAGHINSFIRDIPTESNWFGFSYSDLYEPDNLDKRAARLEIDVLLWAKGENKGPEMSQVYDYVKQDTLNRFDMFRGVFSRSPAGSKGEGVTLGGMLSYWAMFSAREAGTSPVAPSGVYLMNLGNYFDYIVGPPVAAQYDHLGERSYIHLTQDCMNFFDMRFRHEFVWYSSHYFPVYPEGGAKYWDYRRLATDNTFVHKTPELYDPGAWTGHKDDITGGEWLDDPYLRWTELYGWTGVPKQFAKGTIESPFVGGVYRAPDVGDTTIPTPAPVTAPDLFLIPLMSREYYVKRTNFFADVYAGHRMRLAVGPRVPENRAIVMNLVLPTDLTDL